MPITFNTTTNHYVSADDFVKVNPWFIVSIDDRFGTFLNSHRFRGRVEDIQNEQFQSLFDRQVMNSTAFSRILTEHRQLLQTTTDSSIARINAATETKVADLTNDHQSFAQLRQDIANASAVRTDIFIADAKQKMQDEESKRNARLEKLENETDSLKSTQLLTFVGGVLLGGLLTFKG